MFSIILFEDINRVEDPEFYELINSIPDYFVIFSIIFLILTIAISVVVSFYVLFKKKINSYLFMLMIFLWIAFLILITLSIPNIILIIQDLDLLPFWISGFENKSYYYKWIY